MKNNNFGRLLMLIILVSFIPILSFAADTRTLPLDMNLIIDGSAAMRNPKNDTLAWINEQLIDRILVDGDKITIWTAGVAAQVIHSDTVSGTAGKNAIKDKLRSITTEGQTADFTGALRDASARVSQTAANRLAYTVLVTASAEALEPALTGSAPGLFRWFRSKKYERWQVLGVAPVIRRKVQQAAAAYMKSLR